MSGAPAAPDVPLLLGCDFSSSPNRRKPVVLALGALVGARVLLRRIERFESLPAFGHWLAQPGAWLGAFDLPFGLPRAFVQAQGWPLEWDACMDRYASHTREELRARFVAFCAARPAGGKFAHRATDGPAGSSPSMQWVHPPVAWMLHAGVPLLRQAGVWLPGLSPGPQPERSRVAVEGYPGLLAREALGGRRSYKSDTRAKQTPERLIARKDLLAALECGIGPRGPLRLGLRLKLTHAQHDALVADASGDLLDAVLCLMQAAWAQQQHAAGAPRYGLPEAMDPLEGWIATAPWPAP